MNPSRISKVVFLITIVILLSNAAFTSRDYQDSWTLEGLEISFLLFAITYTITFFLEKRVKSMVALATLCNLTFSLVPALKYSWFLGVHVDQHVQYRLANNVYTEGYISTQYPGVGGIYSETPLTHLSFAIFSIVLNIPVVFSIKLIPVVWSAIYPLLMYSVIKNLKFSKRTKLLRYALFISSVPMGTRVAYIVTGSLFGTLLVFLILCQAMRLLQRNDRLHWVVFIFFVFALAMAHSTSSVELTMLLSSIWLLQYFTPVKIRSYLKAPTVLLVMLVSATWLVFSAKGALKDMMSPHYFAYILDGIYPKTGFIPSRFLDLTRINVFEAVKPVLVYHGEDALLLLLTSAGMIFVLKTRNQLKNNTIKFLFLFNVLLYTFLIIGVLSKVGGFFLQRVISFARISFPIFSSIFITNVIERKKWTSLLVFSSIILLSIPQFYGYQPLIPSANTLSKDLPIDEPLVYVVMVNSIYQRSMINYAEKYVRGLIACDKVTTNQMVGLTRYNFSNSFVLWYYPFSRLLNNNITEKEYDYFLIHLPGKSGAFVEKAEIRTKSLILGALDNSSYNLVYSNGESFILAKQ